MSSLLGDGVSVSSQVEGASEEAQHFWDNYFDGFIPTQFPCLSGLRKEVTSVSRMEVSISGAQSYGRLLQICEDIDVLPTAAFQACWAFLLSCYMGRSSVREVAFGNIAVKGTTWYKQSPLASPVIPVRIDFTPSKENRTTVELIRQLSRHYEQSKPISNPGGYGLGLSGSSNFYDTLLAFAQEDFEQQETSKARQLFLHSDVAVMVAAMKDDSGNVRYEATFTNQHLNKDAAILMLQQLDALLQWALSNPNSIFDRYAEALSPSLLSASNAGSPNPGISWNSALLQSQFENHAFQNPDDVALSYVQESKDHRLSLRDYAYGSLNSNSQALANYLGARFGGLEGEVVPILMHSSPELYMAILAILKVGGAWCPIDPLSPSKRQGQLIARTESPLLLTNSDFIHNLTEKEVSGVVFVDVNDALKASISRSGRVHRFDTSLGHGQPATDRPAYLIWTSGTTGPPKGVLISHKAAVASMTALQESIPRSRAEKCVRCMQFSQHTFDVFVQDLFYTWGLGGTLIAASRDLMSTSFPRVATFAQATHAHLTPAFAASVPRSSCPTLEVVTMIGEKLPQHVADDWGSGMYAFNTYGPAEAAVVSTFQQFAGKDSLIKSSNIGRPLRSVSCYVIQNSTLAMRQGVGELAIGGHQLADGYWKDPVKTSERFVSIGGIEERVYKTGDIVRFLADGSLEFVGREDDLIKIQGIRVELSEISFELRGCHQLAEQIETCFMSRPDRPNRVIVAFVSQKRSGASKSLQVGKTDQTAVEIAAAAIKKARKSLPEFMVPTTIIVVDHMPRTTSAKLDTRVLQAAYESVDLKAWELQIHFKAQSGDVVLECTEQALRVIKVIASTTEVPVAAIQVSSYLPALGIDSINAGKLATYLKSSHLSVSVADILRCRTVNDLLTHITSTEEQLDSPSDLDSVATFNSHWLSVIKDKIFPEASLALPVTPLQEGLLTEALNIPLSYWNTRVFEIPPGIDLDRLKSAWQNVCDANEALRTTFQATAEVIYENIGSPDYCTFLQVVHPRWLADWSIVEIQHEDLSKCCKLKAQEIAEQRSRSEFKRPPWAITIFKGAQQNRLAMMVSIHHVLHDEASFPFLIDDVWTSYNGLEPASRRTQLNDVVSRLKCPSKHSQEDDTSFWQHELEHFAVFGDVQVPDLRGMRDNASLSHHGAMLSRRLDFQVPEEDLHKAVRLFHVTPAALFRAAWGQVILRYLEVPKVVFGEAISERLYQPDLANSIAPMLYVMPVAFRLLSKTSELLWELERTRSAFRDHEHIPAASLRKLIGRPKTQPLYPALFNFLPPQGGSQYPWTEIEDLVGPHVEHTLALNVQKLHKGNCWRLELFGDANVIDSNHLQIMCKQVATLLQRMIDSPEKPISTLLDASIPEVVSISRSQLPSSVDSRSRTDPTSWISLHAEKHPGWAAVEVATGISLANTKSSTWNFRMLDDVSNQIATFLIDRAIRGRIVAMCASRSLISYAVIVGIFRSGNTYMPIDESLPQDRKQLLLSDSGSSVLFTDSACIETFPRIPDQCEIVNLGSDKISRLFLKSDKKLEKSLAEPDEDAYLLYTSGSTGLPKGVRISHRNLCGFVEGLASFTGSCMPSTHALGGRGKFLGLASRAFDVHLCEMFLGWRLGLRAVTAPRETLLDDLRIALTTLGVTHACFVPTLLDQVELEPHEVPSLVYFSVGGEKISRKILDVWGNQDQTLVVNAYGPTEAAIGCCASRVTSRSNARDIGKPFGNTSAHVLLPGTLTHAIIGQSGELCITGDLVGNGYFNRPEVQGFVDNYEGQRMYRTGDIVRMMSDGSLEYLGRSDDQTKIRGQRIELGEVTECVKRILEIDADVATLVLKHPDRPKPQLVTFLALRTERSRRYGATPSLIDNAPSAWTEAQAACRGHLPSYMVPDHVIPTSVIPLALTSGKADVKLLKTLFSSISTSELLKLSDKPHRDEHTKRVLTEDESLVKNAALNTLKVDADHIHSHTNLFELGLDSLSAISLTIRLRKLGFESNLAAVFSRHTICELALLPKLPENIKQIERNPWSGDKHLQDFENRVRSGLDHNLDSVEIIRRCLPLQAGILARSLIDTTHTLYINHVLLRLQNTVNIEHLRLAWIAISNATPILRTCFRQIGNDMAQFVLKSNAVSLRWLQLPRMQSDEDFHHALQDTCSTAAKGLMDEIESQPPLSFTVLGRDKELVLSISIHHVLYDAVSFQLLMNDVRDEYFGKLSKQRPSFDRLLGYVAAQDESQQKSFWTNYLADCTGTQYLSDESHTVAVIIERQLRLNKLELSSLASSLKVTVSALSQSCFGVVLSKFLGERDIIFGTIFSGRAVPELEIGDLVAPCLTTIPQRMQFRNDQAKLAQIISETQSSMVECLEFQHTALRKIHHWMNVDKPLFDCLFQYLGEIQGPTRYSDLWIHEQSVMEPDYPLAVEIEPNSETGSVTVRISSKSTNYQSDAETIYQRLDSLITALYNNRNIKLHEVDVTKRDIVVDKNTSAVYEEDHYTHQEFIVRDVVSEVCDIDTLEITKSVSFFQLGIDSITAISFSQRLREAGLKVHASDIMTHACIGDLCKYMKTKAEKSSQASEKGSFAQIERFLSLHNDNIPLIDNTDIIEAAYLCTPLQSGMLTATLATEGTAYVHHHAFRLDAGLDIAKLQYAWQAIVEASDIFRTSFHFCEESPGYWIAGVHKRATALHVKHANADSLEKFMVTIMTTMKFNDNEAFKTPPLEANIVETSTDKYLLLSMHHSLYDGLSIPLVLHDLAQAYRGHVIDSRPPFYVAAVMTSRPDSGLEDFWIETLKGYRKANTIHDRDSSERSVICHERQCQLDLRSVLPGIKRMGVTLQTVALVAYGKVIARVFGRRDLVFGHVVAGRNLPVERCESIVGPLFNTIPLRLRFDQCLRSNEEFCQGLQNFTGKAQDYLHASLPKVQREWRSTSTGPNVTSSSLLDALFLFQKFEDSGFPDQDLWCPIDVNVGITRPEYPLNFEVEQRPDGITVKASCIESVMSKTQLEGLMVEFEEAVQDIIDYPKEDVVAFPGGLSDLPLTTQNVHHDSSRRSDELVQTDGRLDQLRRILAKETQTSYNDISGETSIFAIGLDSMSAIRVASNCRKQGLNLGVGDIIQGQTAAGIIKRCRGSGLDPQQDEANVDISTEQLDLGDIDPDSVEVVLPCLSGQIYHLAYPLGLGESEQYPVFTYRCKISLDSNRLRNAWYHLKSRWSILRTGLASTSDLKPVQVIRKAAYSGSDTFEISKANSSENNESIQRQITAWSRKGFESHDPPARLILLQGSKEDMILINIHHALYDAWSIPMMITDLETLYHGEHLDPRPDFSDYIRHTIRFKPTIDPKTYWQHSLSGCQRSLLKPSPSAPLSRHSTKPVFISLPSALSSLPSLKNTTQSHNLSLSSILILAFARLIARSTRSSNPVFGHFHLGRSSSFPDIERVPGPCLNILPLVVRDALTENAIDAARAIQTDLASRAEHEQDELGAVLRWAGSVRDKEDLGLDSDSSSQPEGSQPLFNAFINILPSTAPSTRSSPKTEGSGAQQVEGGDEPLFAPLSFRETADILAANTSDTGGAVSSLSSNEDDDNGHGSRGLPKPKLPLAREAVYVDIVLDADGETADLAARAEGGLMSGEELKGWLEELGREVEWLRGELGGDIQAVREEGGGNEDVKR
ncbi:hypothetical protein MMC10_007249 [Thelotrema lepadinum]|nr:hypothetical protein [Thelotrema lepadinum]